MKRTYSLIALVLVLAMSLCLFAGCQPADETSAPTTTQKTENPNPSENTNKVTVTWYNGSKELKTEEVEKGSKLTSWTPENGDKEFMGWFAEASLTEAFDFEKEINEDTDIFAAFKDNTYVEDTNNYYLVGSGAGDMKESAWDATNPKNVLNMVKDTTITDKNVYTIEIVMFAGDRFQICYGGGWDGQQGIGHIPGAAYADGINPNDKTEYTAADKKYAEVRNADGELVFIGGDEYNKEFYVWNIILADGMDGKYKFTLTTNPTNPSYNTIEWELIEKVQAQEETHNMSIIGAYNEWKENDEAYPMIPMNKSEDGSYWTAFFEVTPDMYCEYGQEFPSTAIKVFNKVNGAYIGDSSTGANIFLAEGTYCIKYTVEGDVVEVQKLEYYVVGTLLDAEGNSVNFSVKEGVCPKLELVDGVWTATFEAYDATAGAGYDWMTAQGKPGVMAVKVVFGCELGIKDWFPDTANNGDNWYLAAGNYTVTLDVATGTVTVTAA